MFGRRKTYAKGDTVYLFEPTRDFADEFLTMTKASQAFHQPWVYPAMEQRRYRGYIERIAEGRVHGFFVGRIEDNAFLGVININDPILGGFRSASLGYYVNAEYARRGYMSEALALVLDYAFTTLQLHRLEANIQPHNEASRALVQRLGFRKEGFSPAFLQIDGVWRDHERWAILAEEWLGASGLSSTQMRKQFGVIV
jgi:ribosomal-protein-alanine N-acetyltransferase